MPELPEVEIVCRGLNQLLGDKSVIERVEVRTPKLRKVIPRVALEALQGERLCSVERRAKYLLFRTARFVLLNHLGMTGTWRLRGSDENGRTHDHLYLHLRDGRTLAFHDPRRFGLVDVLKKGEEFRSAYLADLGPEPLTRDFIGFDFSTIAKGRKCSIKALLMDQRVVVGIGNIYAAESLFLAGIDPRRPAGKISPARYELLKKSIVQVLRAAIAAGGSTLQDFRQTGGGIGKFQKQFSVYARAQQPCLKCGSLIRSAVLAGRSSFWCGKCQR